MFALAYSCTSLVLSFCQRPRPSSDSLPYPLLVHRTKEGTDCLLFCVLNGRLPLWKRGAKGITFIKQFLRQDIIWVVLQKVDSPELCFCLWLLVLGSFTNGKDLLDRGQRVWMNSSLLSSDTHITNWSWRLFCWAPESSLNFSQYYLQCIGICHPWAQIVIASPCSLAHPYTWWAVFPLTYRGDRPSVMLMLVGGAAWEVTG